MEDITDIGFIIIASICFIIPSIFLILYSHRIRLGKSKVIWIIWKPDASSYKWHLRVAKIKLFIGLIIFCFVDVFIIITGGYFISIIISSAIFMGFSYYYYYTQCEKTISKWGENAISSNNEIT